MDRALLTVGWVATAGLLSTAVLGFGLGPEDSLGLHLLVGLASCFLLLFSHCWIMFYLIGTGKAIREAVERHGFEADLVEQTRAFKNESYPWLMLAMGLAMATFILGGGVATRVLPAWSHLGLFVMALTAQLRTLMVEHRVLRRNRLLMQAVERRLPDGGSG